MRQAMIERVRSAGAWDVVILGGGATGLGTALDSALRGYRTLLLESRDFAGGTSSRSTKLIHGGVRYLARGQVSLVREALHERGVLLANAPHLVRGLPFVLPTYRLGARAYYAMGLWFYDRLAGRSGLPPSRIVSRAEALELAPTLRPDGLRGGVVYEDAQFDDARLAVALLRSFLDAGGAALNYAGAIGLEAEGNSLRRVRWRDEETGEEGEVSARVVVNAGGVFADAIRRLDDPTAAPVIRPSRGAHLVVSKSVLPGDTAVIVPKTDDGRVLFAIPWLGRVLIGTTDTPVDKAAADPHPSVEEVDFLLDHASRYLDAQLDRSTVVGVFAGLRPLVAAGVPGATKTLSREHALFVSPSGLVTIVGGKWTTYRRMARDAVDRAATVAGLPRRECVTESHPLRGAASEVSSGPFASYGADAGGVRALVAERAEWSRPLVSGLPYVEGEVVWAVRHEMARTVDDVLARRTRCLVLDARGSLAAAARVARLIAEELGHDASWELAQVRSFRESASTVPIVEPQRVAGPLTKPHQT